MEPARPGGSQPEAHCSLAPQHVTLSGNPKPLPPGPGACPLPWSALPPLCESPCGPGLCRAARVGLQGSPEPPTLSQQLDPSQAGPLSPCTLEGHWVRVCWCSQEGLSQKWDLLGDCPSPSPGPGPHTPEQWGGGHTDASCLHTGLARLPYLVMRFMGF